MIPSVCEINIAMDIAINLLKCGLKEAILENYLSDWRQEQLEESHMGCTKIVFLPIQLPNWVIKTDIGHYHLCRREVENYRCAIDNHLEDYFAETYYLGEIEGLYFSIQRRGDMELAHDIAAQAFWDSVSDTYIPWDESETVEDREMNISEECEDMLDCDRIFALYGNKDNCDELIDFIEMRYCNDLHDNNYGIVDGELVIVDFSGYWTDEELEDFE